MQRSMLSVVCQLPIGFQVKTTILPRDRSPHSSGNRD